MKILFFFFTFQTAAEYEGQYEKRRENEYSRFHGYAYDGIWAIALAIQKVSQKLKAFGRTKSFRDFQHRDPFWGQLFRDSLNETSFTGVTASFILPSVMNLYVMVPVCEKNGQKKRKKNT